MEPAIFVIGTSQGVGKTVVISGIARAAKQSNINVGVMKPISVGSSEDIINLVSSIQADDHYTLVNPISLNTPLTPNVAFKLDNKRLVMKYIFKAYELMRRKHDFIVMEGLDGIAIPLSGKFFVFDLIKFLNVPMLIVSVFTTDAINHLYLTVELAKTKGIRIKGIIMNTPAATSKKNAWTAYKKEFIETVEEITGLKVVLEVPFINNIAIKKLDHKIFAPVLKFL